MGRLAALLLVITAVATACTGATASASRTPALPLAGGSGADAPAEQSRPPVVAAQPPRAQTEPRGAAPLPAFPFTPHPEWIPTQVNYDEGRDGASIDYIIIHYTAISYERTLVAFNNPNSGVSAHYVVRGDGHIAQLVGEADTAWHAGNYDYNLHAIGIEFEKDPVTNPDFTEAQYEAGAALACAISARHGIPLDREHVIGHSEVPWPNDHTDPGPTWNRACRSAP